MTDADQPAWQLSWLTATRCRLILAIVLSLGFLSHIYYLHHCPIDLSGDEAQYWDWSRQLDLNYYSKGPLVAYIIRASCAIFGDTMPAVRYPAIVLSVATSIVTYLLTRKLFNSEKLALGTVLLFHIVPMFVAGSLLMTIDPPMFFCWALATYFSAIAIFENRRSFWIFTGVAIGIGLLAKYAAFLWFFGLFGFLFRSRERKLAGACFALLVASVFTVPVIIWNIRHHFVSFRHIARQTGASPGLGFHFGNVFAFIGEQIGTLGPTFAVLMIVAVVYCISSKRDESSETRDKTYFLAWIGLAFFGMNLLASTRTKIQINWPAPAYFTLTVLTAYFLSTRLQLLRRWKPWRGWFYASVVIGIVMIPISHDTAILAPLLKIVAKQKPSIGQYDPLARVRGWKILGENITRQLATLDAGAFVMCDDYQQTAEAAFYVAGQPKTFCAGPYFGKRLSQYDIWPDRSLHDNPNLIGKDAVYVGKGGALPDEVANAFERVEREPELDIIVGGFKIRSFKTWRCYNFKGMPPLANVGAEY